VAVRQHVAASMAPGDDGVKPPNSVASACRSWYRFGVMTATERITRRRVVLTGGVGFLGSHLATALCEGNEVILFDIGRRDAVRHTDLAEHPHVSVVRGDVRDAERVRQVVAGADVVIHLAAIAGVSSYYRSGVETMEVNFTGTATVLRAVADRCPALHRFINFSTSEVYGAEARGAREDAPTPVGPATEPRWTYAAGKLAADHLAFAYHRHRGVPVVSIRPFNVYGPRQVGEGAVQVLARRALAGEDLVVTGDGSQVRAWCYVDDLVAAVLRALVVPEAVGQVFNVGNPSAAVTVLDLAERIRHAAESDSKIVFRPHPGVDVRERVPDVSRAREDLDWEPAVGLDEGLKRTVAWYREHPDVGDSGGA